jgi:hypothetical protein
MSDFNQILIVSKDFSESSKYQISQKKNRPLRTVVDTRGQTGRT